MTDRGLPSADGSPACPFVALEDDRDARADRPDHRHRCFAEAQPAPRALAHQEAYCLSSAFPVCPTFQDWARREAARSRDAGAGARATPTAARAVDRGSADPPVVAPGLAAVAAAASDGDARELDPAAVQRGVEDRDPRGSDSTSPAGAAAAAGAAIGAAGSAVGAAGAHRGGSDEAGDPVDERRAARPDDLAQRNPPRDWSAPPPWLASAEARRGDDAQPPSFLGRRASEPGQGLAGSPADQMAGGEATQPRPRDDEEWTSSARTAPPPGQAPARDQAPARRQPAVDDLDDDDDRDDEP